MTRRSSREAEYWRASIICSTNGLPWKDVVTMRFDQAPPEPLAGAVGFLLSWNGQRMAARFAAALEPLDLRPQHFGVMRLLAAAPGATQNDLVQRSMIDASTMVKVIDELEERG